MPPKPKAKPKPQPRQRPGQQSTTVGQTDDTASDQVGDVKPKEEPTTDPNPLPVTAEAGPSSKSYKAASLFLEDQSDDDSSNESALRTGDNPISQILEPESTHGVLETMLENIDEDDYDDDDGGVHSDEDDDPVVQSYDIIVNTTLNEMMYLFQYPVRNKAQPYTFNEGFAPMDARMKVNTGVLELDIPINVDRNYNEVKGMQYGEAVWKSKMQKSMSRNGQGAGRAGGNDNTADRRKRRRTAEDEDDDDDGDEDDTPMTEYMMNFDEAKRKGRVLNKQTLSAKMQSDDANYFVGLFIEDKLHLTRLHGALQLRPQFHHIDVMTDQERAKQKALREANNPNPAKPVEARAVNLTVKAATGDNRTLSGAEQLAKDLRQEEDEQWREIDWVDQDTEEAWQMFANVYKQNPVPLNNALSREEYFKWCSTPTENELGR